MICSKSVRPVVSVVDPRGRKFGTGPTRHSQVASSPAWLVLYLTLVVSTTIIHAFTFSVTRHIRIQSAPLIGGPTWLPLHCKVVIDTTHTFDFVPLDATKATTLQQLVTLQSVPAIVRIRRKEVGDSVSSIRTDRAMAFCRDYDKDLHLIHNNCWTFAHDLVEYVMLPEAE